MANHAGCKWVLLFLFACGALQFHAFVSFFPSVRDVFSSGAIYHVDFPIYYFFHEMTKAFFTDSGTLSGYVPMFMSGYIQTFDFNGLLQILDLLLPWLSTWAFLRMALAVLVIGFPVVIYVILRLFGGLPLASALGTSLAIALFHGSLLSVTTFFGMMNATLVLMISLLGLALLSRAIKRGGFATWLWIALLATVALATHKTAVITFGLPCLVAVVFQIGKPGGRRILAWLCGIWGFALMINLGWITDLFALREYMLSPKEWIDTDPGFVLRDILSLGTPSPYSIRPWSSLLKFLLLVAGGSGALLAWKSGDRISVVIAGGGGFVLFLLSYFGSLWTFTRLTQPIRYQPEVYLLAIVCLTLGLKPLVLKSKKIMVLLLLGIFSLTSALVMKASLGIPQHERSARIRPDKDFSELLAWIDTKTNRKHRILMEDAYGQDAGTAPEPSPYRDVHLMPLVAMSTDRVFVGSFQPSYYYKYRHVNLADGQFLDRPVGTVWAQTWKSLIHDYNIGWCITWSNASRSALKALPELFDDVEEIGRFHCFEVRDKPSWFLEGSGDLDFSVNRITMSHVVPGEKGVLLSFHFDKSLCVAGPARIVPEVVGNDPVPFIRVLHPPDRLEIESGGGKHGH